MNKTTLTIVLATLCLNFASAQDKHCAINKNVKYNPMPDQQNKPYKYGFCGYKAGYKPGVKVTNDVFAKGRMITIRNLPIVQLYAISLCAGKQICEDQVVLDVRDPKKLWELRCYQLIVPADQVDVFYVTMQQNLNREFPEYEAKMEIRDDVMLLIITDKDDQL